MPLTTPLLNRMFIISKILQMLRGRRRVKRSVPKGSEEFVEAESPEAYDNVQRDVGTDGDSEISRKL